jgi:hypothetical protein
MFYLTEVVPASSIWPTATNCIDKGDVEGLLRGYNIEVVTHEGKKYWQDCQYFYGDPEEYYNSEYQQEHRAWYGVKPTGRITFRGYYDEEYDPDERDYFVNYHKDLSESEV